MLTKEHQSALKLGREKNKMIVVFTDKNYIIEKMPLNYKITIKCEKKRLRQHIERDWYSDSDYGIGEAHEMAKYAITEFFIKDQIPVNPFLTR